MISCADKPKSVSVLQQTANLETGFFVFFIEPRRSMVGAEVRGLLCVQHSPQFLLAFQSLRSSQTGMCFK